MGKDDNKRITKIVDERQIVGQRPVTAEIESEEAFKPKQRSPPVRDLARTGVFHAFGKSSQPQIPPDEAPPTEDASRVVRDVVEPGHVQFVQLCPTPLFQLDAEGRIEWANEPFADFARKGVVDLAGERIDTTRLGVIYPSVFDDITTCLAEDQPPTLRQTLRYQSQDGRDLARGCWIVPELDETGRVARLYGYLLPIEE